MRNYLIPLLLVSAAIPAMASADPGDNDQPRAERHDRANRDGGGGGGNRARDNGAARQMQARPDVMRDRRGGMSEAPPQQQAPQQQQQSQQQEAPRQMRMVRTDRGPDQAQQQQQHTDRPSRQADRQVERQQRIEQPQQRVDQQQGGSARPDRAQRNGWVSPNAIPSARQPEVDREQRNRGPRVISTDGLPQENGSLGQRNRADRGDIARQDRPARGSFADRLDHQQERNLARRVRGPGLPPGTVTGIDPRSGGTGSGGLVSTPLPGGGELRHSGSGSQWGTQWRGDRRYDWQDWRRHHHSSFHIGFYLDPFGFGYQRMGYGWQLFPSYYQSSYWLRDPWQYRLPPVYGPYRWVRYYDDALLVDTWSGEVVDVIYNFFW